MAATAQALGYEYIAITDHSKALAMANGLSVERLLKHIEQITKLIIDYITIEKENRHISLRRSLVEPVTAIRIVDPPAGRSRRRRGQSCGGYRWRGFRRRRT